MKLFTDLYIELDQTNKTNEKIEALVRYFRIAPPEDAAWALYFLSGRKPRQFIATAKLRQWATDEAQIPDWLFEESYQAVGDLAETIALLLPATTDYSELPLHVWLEERIFPLRGLAEEEQRRAVLAAWQGMNYNQRLVWNKLVTGSFRVGVSQLLVTRALAALSATPTAILTQRLMGSWEPTADFFQQLLDPAAPESINLSRPYPFHLAYQLELSPTALGTISEWQAEWKWDGIRAQLIHRSGETYLWSRGEELVTERFPELKKAGELLPNGIVLDGEILPWKEGRVLPFMQLQKRIGRKTLGDKLLQEVPVIMQCYDLLEAKNVDIRARPLHERRRLLESVLAPLSDDVRMLLMLSPVIMASSWEQLSAARETSRTERVEGLMLKRLNSPYRVGRHRGDWWKWKIEPFTVDAVLIYAQRGHGRRASLFTDYTFAVWDKDELVPFAKAYSGLTDAEISEVDRFVRDNTIENFGPVRSVKPELVFELAFEGIQKSARHKSGVAVRFPRILRWRTDKKVEEADSLNTIHRLLIARDNEDEK